jgi:hypothetical protein
LPRQDPTVGRDLHVTDRKTAGDLAGAELAAAGGIPEGDVSTRMQSNQRVAVTSELGLACTRQFVHFLPCGGVVQANAMPELLSAGTDYKELAVRREMNRSIEEHRCAEAR